MHTTHTRSPLARPAVVAAAVVVAAVLALVATALGPAVAQDDGVVVVEVLGTRADLVSGGDALVEVTLPRRADPGGLVVTAGPRDVSDAFAVRPGGRIMGLVEGLPVGRTTLRAVLPDGRGATLAVTNHPRGGPVFSGPQIQPWTCAAGALDAQCNRETTFSFRYMPRDMSGLRPYDPASPPPDVATTTTTEGEEVPFIVRIENGTINRDVYEIAVLFDPEAPDYEPWAPQAGFNGRMVITHGASCDTSYAMQDASNGVEEADFLGAGFAVMSHALNNSGHNCNVVVQAEALIMTKEHFVERYGEIRWTIGTGCSGGALAQYWTANAYPGGIYEGITAACSFPDAGSSANQYVDYDLLRAYFESAEGPAAGILWTPEKQAAVYGHPNAINAVTFTEVIPSSGDPSRRSNTVGQAGDLPGGQRCPGLPNDQLYDATTNPDGVRCTLHQYNVNALGSDPTTGWAWRPFSNVGIQYGLQGLLDGVLTPQEFVRLNADVGGWDADYQLQDARYAPDRGGLANIYRSGLNNTASNLDTVAIIDNRGPDPGAFHDTYRTFALEARLLREHGTADNMLMWRGPVPLLGDGTYTVDSVFAMDRWLAAVDADDSDVRLDDKIIANRPDDVTDRCSNGAGQDVPASFCDAVIDVYSTPRIEAGGPLTDDVMQCRLQPLADFDYGGVTFTAAQMALLRTTFPDGVCDWTRPGLDDTDTVPWLDYSTRQGGQPMGPAPVSVPFGPDEEPEEEEEADVPVPTATVDRIAGPSRIDTAVEVSRASWARADTVVLATGDAFADALAGAPLSVAERGPLLLSARSGLPPVVASEIQRLGASRAILLGGPNALAPQVATDLEALGLQVERIAGTSREATAVAIAERLGVDAGVVLASRDSFADALSASALAAARRMPILLVGRTSLGPARGVLQADTDVLVVGGTAVVGEEVLAEADEVAGEVRRLAGADRYGTAARIAEEGLARGLTVDTVWVATGRDFADGLVAGAAAALDEGLLVLVDGQDLAGSAPSRDLLAARSGSISTLRIAGGTAAISEAVRAAITALLVGQG